MIIKQEKWIVLTDVPKDIQKIYTHGGFKSLKEFENNTTKAEVYLFQSKNSASVMMERMFEDCTAFNYIRVEVEIEAKVEDIKCLN